MLNGLEVALTPLLCLVFSLGFCSILAWNKLGTAFLHLFSVTFASGTYILEPIWPWRKFRVCRLLFVLKSTRLCTWMALRWLYVTQVGLNFFRYFLTARSVSISGCKRWKLKSWNDIKAFNKVSSNSQLTQAYFSFIFEFEYILFHIFLNYIHNLYSITMCLGNRAESSAHFINGQLKSQWENATKCVQKHAKNFKPTESVIEFGTSLAQFYGPDRFDIGGKRETSFLAKFNAPHVEFVCNHEVVLFLNLREGYYHLDTSKASPK